MVIYLMAGRLDTGTRKSKLLFTYLLLELTLITSILWFTISHLLKVD